MGSPVVLACDDCIRIGVEAEGALQVRLEWIPNLPGSRKLRYYVAGRKIQVTLAVKMRRTIAVTVI
jgi:hypothetical protein